jgi:type VI secretion system protein VasD
MIHVWQLKTRERFDEANYDTLLMQEEKTLKSDVLAKHTVWMKPAGAVSLNVPLDKETQFVAIVGQFYHPDEQSNSWRLVLKRMNWKLTGPHHRADEKRSPPAPPSG